MNTAPSILSVRELIDTAFGEPKVNIVNHKLIQTILIILARQLRLLERRVEIEMGPLAALPSSTSISVTEVKLQANVPHRKKKGKGGTGAGGIDSGSGGGAGAGSGAGPGAKGAASLKTGMQEGKTKPSGPFSDKSSSSAMKSSTEKSTTDKSSSGVTSSTTKSTTGKSSSDKTEKSSAGKSKSTTEGSKSSSEKPSSGTKSTSEPSSTDKTSTDKSKSTTSTDKSSKGRRSISIQPLPQDYHKLLENIEQQRERELRIIHQRSNSREEGLKTPTPMASMDAMEKQYEKLLIVERAPTDGGTGLGSQTLAGEFGKTPRLSIVTQDEFKELASAVRQLQEKFKIAGVPGLPENTQLMDDLRKGASLTDAMAALQLSARLEAAEKALEKMLSLVTDLARQTPGINLEELLQQIEESERERERAGVPTGDALGKRKSIKSSAKKAKNTSSKLIKSMVPKESISGVSGVLMLPSEMQVEAEQAQEAVEPEEPKGPPDNINYEELDTALQDIYDECLKIVTNATNLSNTNANNALKIALKLEGKLDEALNLGDRMSDLEKLVSEYADKINTLDTELSSQMTNYQEQLTQMQHDLESGLEAMAEALANTGGDTAAVAELNNHFTNLQTDIDIATTRQKELRDMQTALSMDLQGLWKQIEILRETKSDRDEVADALRDKAGLDALNGLVSRQEFDAVRGDFENQIGRAYDKFNNEEITWQKAIDDLIRELNEKADLLQVVSLQESINKYLENIRDKIRAMEEIVGEPRAATVSRKLFRDTQCLSCATPAHMEMVDTGSPLKLPFFPSSRPPAMGAEAEAKPKEDGDHGGVCYPGLPVPHAVDQRAHVCHRYCGGSHTLISTNTLSRAPVGMIINPVLRKVSTAEGTDGKLYMVDETKKPCIPCNFKKTATPDPSEVEPALDQDEFVSDLVSTDFRPTSMQAAGGSDVMSVTPPLPINGEFED